MSSRTSSRSTLTTVPSTMSPSLKYLMVSSMAARNASSEPRSSTVTLLALEVASMLLVMWTVAPNGWIVVSLAAHGTAGGDGTNERKDHDRVSRDRCSRSCRDRRPRSLLPAEAHDPRAHRLAYRAHYHRLQALLRTAAQCSAERPQHARNVPNPSTRSSYRTVARVIDIPSPDKSDGTGESAPVLHRSVSDDESRRANRGWWDLDADDYQAEHGSFLGDLDFVWCPEGVREADVRLLGGVRGKRVLELGAGAAAASRWLRTEGAEVTALDLSAGMLRHARAGEKRTGVRVPLVQ